MFSTLLTFVPLVLAVVGATADLSRPRAVHNSVAKRLSGELTKRYSNARWTFYDVGLGACGKTNVASDFIVALNQGQFGSGYPGPNCFKQIQMSYNGKTAIATIMDECPGCPVGGLDLSRGLFTHFASEDVGVIYGEWSFIDSAAAATTTSTKASDAANATTTKASGAATTTTTKASDAATTTTTKALYVAPTTTTKAPATTTTNTKAQAQATTTTKARTAKTNSSTKKAGVTNSTVVAASAGIHVIATSLSASASSAHSAASSSAATLASSFSSLAPSATAEANGTNTTAVIEANINEINTLVANLGKLLLSAVDNQN